jgi:hypothetical protein
MQSLAKAKAAYLASKPSPVLLGLGHITSSATAHLE